MNVRCLPALLAAALVCAAPAHADDLPRIRIDAGTESASDGGVRIEIDAAWADACPPSYETVSVDGNDIVVRAVRAPGRCDRETTPYRISAPLQDAGQGSTLRDGTYRLRYEVHDGTGSDAQLHGFRLLRTGLADTAAVIPETGFWWPERGGDFGRAGPGIGVQLEVQAGTVSVSALGYTPDGRAGWFYGVGPLEGHIAHLDMNLFDGGAGPFEPYLSPKAMHAIGTIELEVLSPSRATLWFVRAPALPGGPLQLEPMSIVRFSFAQEPGEALLGRWLVVADEVDAKAPLRLRLEAVQRSGGRITLHDTESGHTLDCDSPRQLPDSPPSTCRLHAPGSKRPRIEFTDIGLQQMRGWDTAGRRILAFRTDD